MMKHSGPLSKRADVSRRAFIGGVGALAASQLASPAIAQTRTIKIGYVSPQTGPLATFGETDNFILEGIRASLKDGIRVGGKNTPVEIFVRDSQSSASRAAAVAADLIESENVQLMLVTATPDTTNPVSDQCELAEVPCVSTAAPWEAWFFGRGGVPDKGFRSTFHFFFGLSDAIGSGAAVWSKLPTNKVVGGLFPNDSDGSAWSDPKVGFPAYLPKAGFELINPGTFTGNTDNFTAHINAFKEGGVEILTGVLNPPDWNTFWKQSRQQGFKPKIAMIAKAVNFPAAVATLGDLADGLATWIVWSPDYPFSSSLTGQSSKAIADSWSQTTNKLWTPPLGWTHAVFEVGIDALKRSADPFDLAANVEAVAKTRLDTVMGRIDFSNGPVKNVCVTPTVGGQWKMGGRFGFDIDIVANETLPAVPVTAALRPLKY